MAQWMLASSDRTMVLELNAADDGALNGTLTYLWAVYSVAGGWDAAGSIPGRNYSAFSLSGRTTPLPDVPNWISASGIMTGPGAAPTQITIQADVASSSDGSLRPYEGVLIPV